jgi:transposase
MPDGSDSRCVLDREASMHGEFPAEDLRVRVIEAVRAGASRRQTAARFGVIVSSAIRWVAEWRASGRTAPRAQGGDRRSDRIEAQATFLLARIAERPDVTLAELREALWRERGLRVAVSTLWRFFDRRRITLKKRRRMPPSRSART